MGIDLLLVQLLTATCILLIWLGSWHYFGLLLLCEVVWLGLTASWLNQGLCFLDLSSYFWGFGWVFFSAAELGVTLFVYLLINSRRVRVGS